MFDTNRPQTRDAVLLDRVLRSDQTCGGCLAGLRGEIARDHRAPYQSQCGRNYSSYHHHGFYIIIR